MLKVYRISKLQKMNTTGGSGYLFRFLPSNEYLETWIWSRQTEPLNDNQVHRWWISSLEYRGIDKKRQDKRWDKKGPNASRLCCCCRCHTRHSSAKRDTPSSSSIFPIIGWAAQQQSFPNMELAFSFASFQKSKEHKFNRAYLFIETENNNNLTHSL